jgi:hypothetical protein
LGDDITVGRRNAQVKATFSRGRESATRSRKPAIHISHVAEWLLIALGGVVTDLIGDAFGFRRGGLLSDGSGRKDLDRLCA